MNLPWKDVLDLGGQLAWLVIGPLLLLWLLRCGCLGAGAFRQAPDRRTGLQPLDLAAGFAVMILGSAMTLALIPPLLGSLNEHSPLPQLAAAMVLGQLLSQGSAVAYLLLRAPFGPLGLLPGPSWRDLRSGALGLLTSMPLVMMAMAATAVLGTLIGDPPDALGHSLLQRLATSRPEPAWLLIFFSVVVLAPVLEELLYRGLGQTVLLNALGPAWRWPILILVSAGFAFVHLGAVRWHALPALFLLGLLFGWLYERTGSLWPPILMHAGFNAVNLLATVFLFGMPEAQS